MAFLQPLAANVRHTKRRYVRNKLIQTHMLYGPNELEYENVRRYSLRNNLLDNNQMNNVIQNLVPHYQNIITNNIEKTIPSIEISLELFFISSFKIYF